MAFGADLATGLLSSAIFEGIKQPLTGTRAALAGRRAILDEFNARPSAEERRKDKSLATAFDDLVRVLGNEYGKYTEDVDQFLGAVQRSAVPAAIFKACLCNIDPVEAFPAFNSIYSTFDSLPFESRELFVVLTAAIKSRIHSSTNDPAVVEILHALAEEHRASVQSILRALEKSHETPSGLNNSQIRDSQLRLARAIESDHRDLAVETERGVKRVAISRLVIPARLTETDLKSMERDSENGRELNVSPDVIRLGVQKAVVVGDPGGGKSTLVQWLCYMQSRNILSDTTVRRNKVAAYDKRLPIKVTLRTYEPRRATTSIFDYLVEEIKGGLEDDEVLAKKFLRHILSVGDAILLFDGLDEILDVSRRRELVAAVERFSRAYAACPAIITSRIIGYRDAPLGDEFRIFKLAKLSRSEVGDFAARLISVILSCKRSEASEKAENFLRQTEKNAADLRVNPLLLGLMVHLFAEQGDVPDNRPEIYKACATLMFLKWDQNRDIRFEYPDDFELLDLFGFIATRIFGDPEREDGVAAEWLKNEIRSFFLKWYNDQVKAYSASTSLVNFITGRAWVMCDVGPSVYKFTHRTFLEYFVARRIESESESLADLHDRLYPRVLEAEWDVVTHLALQIAASSGPKAGFAAAAMRKALQERKRTPREELNYLRFVARALEYLSLPESTYSTIVIDVMARAAELGAGHEPAAIGVFTLLLQNFKKKRDLLSIEMAKFVSLRLREGSEEEARFLMLLLGERERHGVNRLLLYGLPVDSEFSMFDALEPVRCEYETNARKRAQVSLDWARLYSYTYDCADDSLYRLHGLALLLFRPGELDPPEFARLKWIVLGNTFGVLLGHITDSDNRERCIDLLRPLASDLISGELAGAKPVRSGVSEIRWLDDVVYALFHTANFDVRSGRTKSQISAVIDHLSIVLTCLFAFSETIDWEWGGTPGSAHSAFDTAKSLARMGPPDLFQDLVSQLPKGAAKTRLEAWLDGGELFFSSAQVDT